MSAPARAGPRRRRPRRSGRSQVVVPRLFHLLLDDLGHLLYGPVDLAVFVHHHVVIFRCRGHLDLGVAHAEIALLRRLGPPLEQPLAQIIERRRHDEDGQGLRQHHLDLPHSLRLGLADHDLGVAERVRERVAADAFEVPVDHGPFEEVARLDLRAELLRLVKVVMLAMLFVRAGLPARRGHVDHRVVKHLDQPLDDRVLTPARRRRNDHKEPLPVERRQRTSSQIDVATAGVPRLARYVTRSGASGAVNVRSPACGRRTVRRQACRNWRSRPLRSPRLPYTGSPTIGIRAKARCARIWCVLPVIGVTCRSACRSAPLRQAAIRTNWVTESRPPARITMRRRSSASRCRGASTTAGRSPGSPQTSARYSFRNCLLWSCRESASCATSVFATTRTPLVSLSRRCTIPGRAAARPVSALIRPTTAFTSVPLACPYAGCTTRPAGLFNTI